VAFLTLGDAGIDLTAVRFSQTASVTTATASQYEYQDAGGQTVRLVGKNLTYGSGQSLSGGTIQFYTVLSNPDTTAYGLTFLNLAVTDYLTYRTANDFPGLTTLVGQSDDQVNGGAGADRAHGWDGNDALYGGAGADTLYGDGGLDWIDGDDGNDQIYGGAGNDFMRALDGDDRA
jgi:Ca2+-binding RTX toxin-like protein